DPHAGLALWRPLAAAGQAAVQGGGGVLVDGAAVGDEAEPQLQVAGQAAVRGQRQDQQRRDQQEAHHQQGHRPAVRQQNQVLGLLPLPP
ncbi:hypothetical protein COCON_G00071830, partial [Conger conger]